MRVRQPSERTSACVKNKCICVCVYLCVCRVLTDTQRKHLKGELFGAEKCVTVAVTRQFILSGSGLISQWGLL